MEKNTAIPDDTDRHILRMLQQNAMMTIKEMAEHLHLTSTPVFERVKRLEREGYIAGYSALLDRRKAGLGMLVMCDVSLKEHNINFLEQFENAVKDLPEVLECYHLAGAYDYLLKVVVSDIDAYQRFIKERLAALENIGRVQSHFVMTEIKSTTVLPV